MVSYQYGDSYYKDEMVLKLADLSYGNPCTVEMISLYRIDPQYVHFKIIFLNENSKIVKIISLV